jgi:molybdopterin-guanine dinucleotide biosynthesis protein A
MSADSFAAVLLAGGRSTRFGSDKALFQPPGTGQPLWGLQLDKLRALGASEVVISAAADGPSFPVPSGVRVVLDEVEGAGPLAGLAAVLGAVEANRILVLGIDMPAVSVAGLRLLLEAAPGAGGLVPRLSDRWEPLLAIYPTRLADLARERLLAGQRSLQGFVDAALTRDLVAAWPVPSGAEPWFANLNHPGDASAL